MRVKTNSLLLAAIAAACFLVASGAAWAAKQVVAFFPLQNLSDNTIAADVDRLGRSIGEKLQDRLDVRIMAAAVPDDLTARRNKARGMGATYILAGAVSRIGRSVTLDLTLSTVEDPGKGRTLVVTGVDDGARKGADPPPAYARMATEAASRLKYLFFGDETVGEGAGRRKIPRLSGTVSRSRDIVGDVVSVARNDTDRDGKMEIVAAYPNDLAVYRMEGDDLVEKARITDAGADFIHVDAADINRNGIAEIISVRYVAGKSLSDVWEYDGDSRQYKPIARDIPYFLRALDIGKDGIVLAAQESDPVTIHKGPVFRLAPGKYGAAADDRSAALPLPDGTWIYSFAALNNGGKTRFATINERDRLNLLDENGKKLWEGMDSVSGTETAVRAPLVFAGKEDGRQDAKRLFMPNRMFGADLDGDRTDELIVMNNIVTAGAFFENIRVYSNAEAMCFAQDGDSLQLAWRTPQTGSSARDSFIDFSPSGRTLRIGIASRDKGKILGQFGEWNLIWLK
ncbi:MAG: VCBS repeat-containing protein [Deltaproteobacteria bacterium]|nr:VCBS repeat-containing protein [Deltaproteobacteria bacterium]